VNFINFSVDSIFCFKCSFNLYRNDKMGDRKLLDRNMMKLMAGKLQNDVCWRSIRIANSMINCMPLKNACYGGS
jgi:hypothetical protein